MSDIKVNVDELRQRSIIYKNLQPGAFLFEYRSKLNEAAFQVALENPILLSTKNKLLELAKEKVEKDGYNYKKKKSRSSAISPQPEKKSQEEA